MDKPADVHPKHWKKLVTMPTTKAVHPEFEHMCSISKRKGSKILQMKAIKRGCVKVGISPAMLCSLKLVVDVISNCL